MNRPIPARLDSRAPDFTARLSALLAYEPAQDEAIERTVAQIVADVRKRGDEALLEYTRRFDRLEAACARALELPGDELRGALDSLAPADRDALQAAAARIRGYHERQLAHSWSYVDDDGTRLGQRISPIDRVGLYVPGGKAAYPSSVLMNALPARVAGVRELVMVVPTPDGVRNPMVLAAACIAGVDRVFTIGGAQAVAALAWGTETVPAVDKIVGPGNAYVAEAKRRVFGTVGIDMIAGPSEILVLCDGSTDPDWIAADLFSQAEHDEMAQAILLTPDAAFADRVAESIARLLPTMPRREIIERSLADRGAIVVVRSMEEACEIATTIAAEHVEISARDAGRWVDRIRHAGAIFLGPWSSEAIGDYCAGPNHVLPTMRTARFSSPLGVYDFQKRTSLIEVSGDGARTLGAIAATLARAEGLEAHARSAQLRVEAPRVRRESAAPERFDPIRPEIVEMSGYQVLAASGMIKLDAMENPYRMPPELRRALGEGLAEVAINRYPAPGHDELAQAIRERFAVPADAGLVLGNGSDELITMLAVAVARPGAVHLAPQPSFVMYELSARLAGSRFVGVALRADFSLDIDAMLSAIAAHRPAVVWLAWPNNPTGNAFAREDVEAVLAAAPGLVVLDEAYQPFAQDTWMQRLRDHERLVVLRTVSKLGLAGLRLGYLAAATRWTEQLQKVRPPYNVNVLTDAAARFALGHLDVLDAQAARIRAGRELLAQRLRELPGVEVFPSLANFVLVRVADSERTERGLRSRGLLIKDLGRMHPLLRNCLRLTVGTEEENRLLLGALRESL
ncbi:MAG: hypothetical protein DCC72_08145 [Burkholderiales bacterium]|nr:MAG: hypothetical protein DCC72_08145 [Burkholderiales bacterium]